MTVGESSEELSIKDSTPRRRANGYREMGEAAFPGNGSPRVNKDHEVCSVKLSCA